MKRVDLMVSITGYGGVNEIGGNKFVIQDEKARIMLDFGLSFSTANSYLDEFLQPRKFNGIDDYKELGLLPDIKGIYRTDYLKHTKAPEEALEFDAVFLSHAHADHASYVHFLREDLPIHATPETFAIMRSIEDTAGSSTLADLCTFTRSFQYGKTKDGKPKRLKSDDEGITIQRPLKPMKTKVTVGDFEIEAIPVNHSLLGVTAFLIHTPKGDIAYSGDLRFHGYGGHLTEQFIKKVANVKYLMMEGTRIDSTSTKTEAQVQQEISKTISETKGLVIINWPSRDTDRLWSVYRAAVENDRLLVISTKQAHLLEKLLEVGADVPKLDDKNIRIFMTRRGWGFLGSDAPKEEIERDYSSMKWELTYLNHKNAINYKDLQKDYSKYALRADLFDMTELIDIKPPENSIYIRSVVEPFDDEMMVSDQKLRNWMKHFGIMVIQSHCSGHAPGPDLIRIIKEIQPEFIIPIHTVKPRKFRGLGPTCVYPKFGRGIEIK